MTVCEAPILPLKHRICQKFSRAFAPGSKARSDRFRN